MGMDETRCSFCNKPAAALIKAPNAAATRAHGEVYICTECVRACAAILDSNGGEILLRITKETVQ
jgi:ClpX C4-type zinc finger